MAEPSGINLTGAWTGVYFYPVDAQWNPDDDMAPTPFKADLIDIDGHTVGQFDASDEAFLERVAEAIADRWQ